MSKFRTIMKSIQKKNYQFALVHAGLSIIEFSKYCKR